MPQRKFDVGDRVVQYESGSQYWVVFDDGRKECVYDWWLEKEPPDSHS